MICICGKECIPERLPDLKGRGYWQVMCDDCEVKFTGYTMVNLYQKALIHFNEKGVNNE